MRTPKPIRAFNNSATDEMQESAADVMLPILCLSQLLNATITGNFPLLDITLRESDLKDSLRRLAAQTKNLCLIFEQRISDELLEGLYDDSDNIYKEIVEPMVLKSKESRPERFKK